MPNIGEAMVPQGSGHPYAAATDNPPAGFKVGDILRLGSKTFVLGKAGAAITNTDMGLKNTLPQGVANSAVAAIAAAGATEVILTTSATAGAAGTGLIAADEFAGGEIVFFINGVSKSQRRGIVGNTARVASGSLPVTFTLDSPLTYALSTSDTGEALHSPWAAVAHDTSINHCVVGLPTVLASIAQYLWVQTGGPAWASPQAGVGVAGARGLYWRHDGSLDVTVGTYVSSQYAGFVLSESSTGTQDAPFFMLQILQ